MPWSQEPKGSRDLRESPNSSGIGCRDRDTPTLQTKRDVRNFWTSILLTAGQRALHTSKSSIMKERESPTRMGFFSALDGSLHSAGSMRTVPHDIVPRIWLALSGKAVLQLLAGIGSASAGPDIRLKAAQHLERARCGSTGGDLDCRRARHPNRVVLGGQASGHLLSAA